VRSQKSYRTPLIGIAVRLDERTRPLRLLPCVTSTRHRASVMTWPPHATSNRARRTGPFVPSSIIVSDGRECQCASVIPVMRNREKYHRTPSHPNPESQEWTTPRYLLPDIRIDMRHLNAIVQQQKWSRCCSTSSDCSSTALRPRCTSRCSAADGSRSLATNPCPTSRAPSWETEPIDDHHSSTR
jgi:hypothetical protein